MRPLFAVLIGLVLASPSTAAMNGCTDAWSDYERRVNDLDWLIERYTRCVEHSQGRDECASHFHRLRTGHIDYASAVSAIAVECN